MANPEHLDILKQGVEVWNKWREENPKVRPDLSGANLKDRNLYRMNLQGANLFEANLMLANLTAADLSGATLTGAKLLGTFFIITTLTEAFLYECEHRGPCTFDLSTLSRNPNLPTHFLQGCGLSDLEIEFYKLYQRDLSDAQVDDVIYRMHDLRVGKAIQFYSCFISYSSDDGDFAKKLHDDLQEAGVRCWFAPEDLKIGEKFRAKIDEAIRSHEKLLLILSEAAIHSGWVEYEANRAHRREMKEMQTVLFPVRLDDAILRVNATWADFIRDERHIGNFRQ